MYCIDVSMHISSFQENKAIWPLTAFCCVCVCVSASEPTAQWFVKDGNVCWIWDQEFETFSEKKVAEKKNVQQRGCSMDGIGSISINQFGVENLGPHFQYAGLHWVYLWIVGHFGQA